MNKRRFNKTVQHRITALTVLLCCVLLLSGCASTEQDSPITPTEPVAVSINPIDPGGIARLDEVDCWFNDPGALPRATCFWMNVPESHGDPDSRAVRFPVVRLSNPWGDSSKTPILHLGGGGPGNPMGLDPDSVGSWIWSWYQEMSIGDNRDLYLLDPRGVGMAAPVLVCSEYIPGFLSSIARNLTVAEEVAWNQEVNQQCVDRLTASGIDVGAYNSIAVAHDMELVRQQFDVTRWNLYGVSYASRYALTMAREYPDRVESMVLDAAVFPHVRYMDNYAKNLEDAYQRQIDHCAASETCSAAIGDPGKRFWQLVRQLNHRPIVTTVQHPSRDQRINFVLNGNRFLGVMYNALYDAARFDQLDETILALESGKLGVFESQVNEWLAFQTDDDYGDASAAAHYCFEESPFIDYPLAVRNAQGLRNELRESAVALLRFNEDQCQRWPVPAAGAVEGEPVTTAVPALFLHGALDPVLPVDNLEAQLVHFDNGAVEIFDDTSHSIVGVHPCGEQLASAFYHHKMAYRQHIDCAGLD